MNKRWKIKSVDEQKVLELASALNVHPLISRMLVARNINSFEEARSFFRPDITQLHDPWLMKDMDLAVKRILRARDHKEKILVYGDYDVDGTSSAALLYQFLIKVCEKEDI